ncbi:MAG: BON domain-containing protein [Chloroflexi bacterium]|nr:BON domain-containing protein [Chloroflexota bacterium]
MTNDPEQCSDEKLRDAILSRLAKDNRTAFANLRVGVLNGIAHIAGVVSSLEIYVAAAEITGSVRGVRGVVNRIEAPGAPSPSRTIHLDLPAANTERKDNDKIPE